jgi:hypothetical protein
LPQLRPRSSRKRSAFSAVGAMVIKLTPSRPLRTADILFL